MAIREKRKEEYYVDNKLFYQEMKKWKDACKVAKENNKNPPQPSRYISESLMNIVYGLSKKNNFKSYTYKDEMISDGLENVVQALPSFNPDKGNNPFGYFSLVAYYAFLRRIDKEKRQTYIKYKIVENMSLSNDLSMKTEVGEKRAIDDVLANEKMQELARKFENEKEESGKNIKPKAGFNTVWQRKDFRVEKK